MSETSVSSPVPVTQCITDGRKFCSTVSSSSAGKLGDGQIQSIHLGSTKVESFFSRYFPGRLLKVTVKLSEKPPIEKVLEHSNHTYELLSFKNLQKKPGNQHFASSEADAEFLYVATAGGDMQPVNLQQDLERICRLGSLGANAVTGLDLLQSEAQFIVDMPFSSIELIKDQGHEGCGFMPFGFFDNMKEFPFKKKSVLQIIIAGPKIGLVKGLLLAKKGIHKIQIPQSMLKALPSEKVSPDDDLVSVIVKGSAPSENNGYLARQLDPMKPDPRVSKSQKPLSGMYERILLGIGLPKELLDDYVSRARKLKDLRHTHLKGVADPTGKIPHGKAFVPGYATNPKKNGERDLFTCCVDHGVIFVSRSPCVEPADARILELVQTRPSNMSADEWTSLCNDYEFGTIIFGLLPESEDVPIPNMMADRDLDGDLYFSLWDPQILNHLLHSYDSPQLEAPDTSNCYVNKSSKLDEPYDEHWLSKAQDKMMDTMDGYLKGRLVCTLYYLCQKSSDIYDEDSIAFGKAYRDAMGIQKHGGRVYLPAQLQDMVPKDLRRLLSSD